MFRRQPPDRKWKLLVVSHTHWDREWYRPFESFRAMLVDAVDSLLDLMAADPNYRYFTLDGQTVVLEDYLEVRPERGEELGRLIREGRVLIGPWYVMPDEFLVSAEAIVRNLLEGRRTGEQFGPVMSVGYIPDPFGHIAQMPQILRGFGIDSAILWRGIGADLKTTEAHWESPDGSRVMLEHMLEGYSNGSVLPSSPDALMERISHIRSILQPAATTTSLLLMNGDDHMFPQPEIPTIIQEANKRLRDGELVHATLPMMVDRIREAAEVDGSGWPVLRGEFRSSQLSHLLAGVLSTRMNIKQRNARCQLLLERWAEPFSVYASILGQAAGGQAGSPSSVGRDRGLLRVAWRHLLKNHPHDSICGCSVDQVHQEMESRFDWSEQVAEVVASRSLMALAEETDSASLLGSTGESGAIALFNSEAGPRTDWVTTTAQLPAEPTDLVLADAAGNTMPFQLLRRERQEIASASLSRQEVQGYLRLSGPGKDWPRWKLRILEKIIRATLRGSAPDLVIARMEVVPGADPTTVDLEVEASSGGEHNYDSVSMAMRQLNALVERGDVQFFRIRAWRGDQAEIGFVARDVPPYGVKLFHFQRATPAGHAPLDEHEWPTLENEYLSLQVSPEDGSGHLLDRESGAIYWGINGFLDEGDAGDEYTFSPPPRELAVKGPAAPPRITWEDRGQARQRLRVEMVLSLPEGLTEDRKGRSNQVVDCHVTSWLSVYPGIPRLDISTTVVNRARDHRLRVRFPTRLKAEAAHADGHFTVLRRPLEPVTDFTGWMEHPTGSSHMGEFVDISDGVSGLMIAGRGLPEYEVVLLEEGPCIQLTLLRAVGWLSRDDLGTRQGAAGPFLPTPGAQLLGSHTFDYAVIPHPDDWRRAAEQARWFTRPMLAQWTGSHPGAIPPETSFLRLSPADLVLSAVKPTHSQGSDIIVRLFNPTEEPLTGQLTSLFPLASAQATQLDEREGVALPLEDGSRVPLSVAPHQIVTLRLRPRQPA